MSDSMPLVRIHGVEDVRIDDVPIPECGEDDVLVEVSSCGVCGTDVAYVATGGLLPPGVPMPLGHELSGTVSAVGRRVKHVTVGQRVVVQPTANGTDIGNGGPEGGFAPLLRISGAGTHPDAVRPLPENMSFEQGALVEPMSVAMHGVNQSGIQPGQSVLVLGSGPIGLSAVVVLRHYGVEEIVVADPSPFRLDLARQLGASATCEVGRQDLMDVLTECHGEMEWYGERLAGTDVYIEATGLGPVLEQAIGLSRYGATVVVVGVHHEPIQLHPRVLLTKELRLIGSMAYPDEFPAAIEMLSGGTVDTTPLITHRFALSDFHQALAVAGDPQQAGKVMIHIR
ncbi:MAG: zinc-binding dehydrogenase [Proteobacteria bacterium]|nr:zinc-binding dehydrogenase [Pseudomonadota bacterium]